MSTVHVSSSCSFSQVLRYKKVKADIHRIIIFFGTWLTAGLGVFLDFASSFFSAASFLPPKLDLGVEVCDLEAAAGTGV